MSKLICNYTLASQAGLTGEIEQEELAKYEDTIRQNNPDYYVRAEIIGSKKVVTLICKKCGYVIVKKSPDKNYSVPECGGCKIRLKHKGYLGKCQLSQKYMVYNGIEIIKQYTDPVKGYLCDIKCAICGRQDSVVKGVYLIDVINGKYFHDCDYPEIIHKCENCGNQVQLTIKEIVTTNNTKCSKCGKPLDNTELRFKILLYDRNLIINKVRKAMDEEGPISKIMIWSNNTLLYDQIPIYRRNGENYHRCFCITHGLRLILSETEIYNYNCEKCKNLNK